MKIAPPWTPSTRALGSTGAPSPIRKRCLPPAALRPTEPSFPEGGEPELALPFVDPLLAVWLPRRPAATTTVHLAVNLIQYYRAKVRFSVLYELLQNVGHFGTHTGNTFNTW
ncbi:hypothetical protein VPH35_036731 [Triticum aestivum]